MSMSAVPGVTDRQTDGRTAFQFYIFTLLSFGIQRRLFKGSYHYAHLGTDCGSYTSAATIRGNMVFVLETTSKHDYFPYCQHFYHQSCTPHLFTCSSTDAIVDTLAHLSHQ